MFVVVAQDTRAASIVFSYIQAHFDHGILKSQMNEATATEIRLKNRAVIGTFSSTIRSLRGWSIPCGAMDELAFWRAVGAADSDEEVQASSRRGGLSFPVQRLVKVSTPYLKSGVLHADHQQSFGVDDPDRLVVVASSALMNPTITDKRLARERRRDPSRYEREYMAVWIDSLTAFLSSEWIEPAIGARHPRATPRGRHQLRRRDRRQRRLVRRLHAGDLPRGRVRHHRAGRDALLARKSQGRGRDLEGVVAEVADIVKRYGCPKILGRQVQRRVDRAGHRAPWVPLHVRQVQGQVRSLPRAGACSGSGSRRTARSPADAPRATHPRTARDAWRTDPRGSPPRASTTITAMPWHSPWPTSR